MRKTKIKRNKFKKDKKVKNKSAKRKSIKRKSIKRKSAKRKSIKRKTKKARGGPQRRLTEVDLIAYETLDGPQRRLTKADLIAHEILDDSPLLAQPSLAQPPSPSTPRSIPQSHLEEEIELNFGNLDPSDNNNITTNGLRRRAPVNTQS